MVVSNMPHVVLDGKVKIQDIFQRIDPLFIRDGENVLKTANVYIERAEKNILVDSLVIEGGKRISFFTVVSERDDGVVIRIYPMCEVEKTSGVRRVLAELAKQLLQIFPELKLGATNLAEFLK